MLRLLRHTDKNFSVFTSFVFPKKECPQCVIKVTVKWQKLRFRYALQRLQDIQQAVGEVQAVLRHQRSAVPTLPKEIKPQLMLLSQDELNGLSSDAPVQLPSQRNIVVADAKYIYKVLCEVESERNLALLYVQRGLAGQPKHFVLPCPFQQDTLFKYEKVHNSPLEVKDASKVLQTLAEKIKAALDELHEQGFMHCAVRLPNICFNEQLDAVLIDVDRACRTNNGVTRLVGVVDSCMYRVPRGARETKKQPLLLPTETPPRRPTRATGPPALPTPSTAMSTAVTSSSNAAYTCYAMGLSTDLTGRMGRLV